MDIATKKEKSKRRPQNWLKDSWLALLITSITTFSIFIGAFPPHIATFDLQKRFYWFSPLGLVVFPAKLLEVVFAPQPIYERENFAAYLPTNDIGYFVMLGFASLLIGSLIGVFLQMLLKRGKNTRFLTIVFLIFGNISSWLVFGYGDYRRYCLQTTFDTTGTSSFEISKCDAPSEWRFMSLVAPEMCGGAPILSVGAYDPSIWFQVLIDSSDGSMSNELMWSRGRSVEICKFAYSQGLSPHLWFQMHSLLLYSHDSGTTWTYWYPAMNTPELDSIWQDWGNIQYVEFLDDESGFMILTYQPQGPYQAPATLKLMTADGGLSWQHIDTE